MNAGKNIALIKSSTHSAKVAWASNGIKSQGIFVEST
jgi:hypothetical protein